MSAQVTVTEGQVEQARPPEVDSDHTVTGARPQSVKLATCPWLPAVSRQLEAIAGLQEGWDSHGAPGPEGRVVKAASQLLSRLCSVEELPRPHVNPTPSGGVQFEWEATDRYFELEVVAERAATYLYCDEAAGMEKSGELFEGESLEAVVGYIRSVAAAQ